MTALGEIRIVHLKGTPRQRGRVHGEALRSLITAGMERWKGSIHESTGRHPDEYLDRFVEETDFMSAIERWAPHLLDEVRGIGEGAGISFRDVYAYQLMDEEWIFRAARMPAADARDLEHCSVVGVFGEDGAPTILAQNMDLPKCYDGTQALLHGTYHGSTLESFVFAPAGLIATTGLNNRGIGLCVNTLAQLRPSIYGLPVAFVARRILEHETLDEAIGFVRGILHASGQNYAIGVPGRIVDVECSATKIVSVTTGPTRIYHTNHPLVNDDQPRQRGDLTEAMFGKGFVPEGADAPSPSDSERRLAYLKSALDDTTTRVTVDAAKEILSTCDIPISVLRASAGQRMTLGSLVMELSSPPVLHLSPGPPAETVYQSWTF